jgi:hypothetical protein
MRRWQVSSIAVILIFSSATAGMAGNAVAARRAPRVAPVVPDGVAAVRVATWRTICPRSLGCGPLIVVSGSSQTARPNSGFRVPLVVEAVGATGRGIAGERVTFMTPAHGATGSFAPCGAGAHRPSTSCTVVTDASGDATASLLTADSRVGRFAVTVSSDNTMATPALHLAIAPSPLSGSATLVLSATAPALLYPGSTSPLDVTITNDGSEPALLDAASLSVAFATTTPMCGSSNFALVRGLGADVTIAPASTASLASLRVPRGLWPVLQMVETQRNQDACAGITVTLQLSGSTSR